MGWESSDSVRFDLGPLFQGQRRITKVKSAHNLLIIGDRGLQCETNLSYRKSWAGNLLMWSDFDLEEDLGPLLQGQTKIAYNSIIIGPRGLQRFAV